MSRGCRTIRLVRLQDGGIKTIGFLPLTNGVTITNGETDERLQCFDQLVQGVTMVRLQVGKHDFPFEAVLDSINDSKTGVCLRQTC